MSSRRITLIALLLIAAGLAALAAETAIVGSENPMSLDQHNRMTAISDTLWLVFLLMQIPIVWLVTNLASVTKPLSRLLQVPLSLLASVACSLCVGALLLFTFEGGWYSLALQFK
jgi:hypothetical protein